MSGLYAAFKRTEGKLIAALDRWSHRLAYPGGFDDCGRCGAATQWGFCPVCQPDAFWRLP